LTRFEKDLWEITIDKHGHVCPGVTIGYKAALYAKKLLDLDFSEGERVVCITTNETCPVDAIRIIMRCGIEKDSTDTSQTGRLGFVFHNQITRRGIRLSYTAPNIGGTTKEETQQLIFHLQPEELFTFELLPDMTTLST